MPIYNASESSPPSTAPICVSYKVASDKAFSKVVDSGMAYTSSDVDYTLKVIDCCLLARDRMINRIRSKLRTSARTLTTTTVSVYAAPTLPAQLDVLKPHPHLMTW